MLKSKFLVDNLIKAGHLGRYLKEVDQGVESGQPAGRIVVGQVTPSEPKPRFISEVKYPEWLANVVVVPKNSGKWHVCVDYTSFNEACPKDSFPLPRID